MVFTTWTAREAARRVAAREVSVVELTAAALALSLIHISEKFRKDDHHQRPARRNFIESAQRLPKL